MMSNRKMMCRYFVFIIVLFPLFGLAQQSGSQIITILSIQNTGQESQET